VVGQLNIFIWESSFGYFTICQIAFHLLIESNLKTQSL
jgi:hypothetical protein